MAWAWTWAVTSQEIVKQPEGIRANKCVLDDWNWTTYAKLYRFEHFGSSFRILAQFVIFRSVSPWAWAWVLECLNFLSLKTNFSWARHTLLSLLGVRTLLCLLGIDALLSLQCVKNPEKMFILWREFKLSRSKFCVNYPQQVYKTSQNWHSFHVFWVRFLIALRFSTNKKFTASRWFFSAARQRLQMRMKCGRFSCNAVNDDDPCNK